MELENIKWDILGISEVRRHGECLETLTTGHKLYYKRHDSKSEGGLGFFHPQETFKNIKLIQAIFIRVIYIILRLNNR